MKTTCPACGAQNNLLRIFLYWTGLHLRCRACRQVYRLVETAGGVFTVLGAFGAVYVLAFWVVSQWPLPEELGPEVGALWMAGLPALPAVVAVVAAVGWLHRLGPPDPEKVPRLTAMGFFATYVIGTVAIAALVAVMVFGILITRFGEEMPRPEFGETTAEVAVSDAEADEFVFVDLVGKPRSLLSLRGSVVLVHLFDPDTRGTTAVLATLRELRKTAQDDGVLFAVVADCGRDRLAAFVDHGGAPRLPYTFLDGPLPDAMRSLGDGRPATFVVDRDGSVVFAFAGIANWATDEARAFLGAVAAGNG